MTPDDNPKEAAGWVAESLEGPYPVHGCARCGGEHPDLPFRYFPGTPNPTYELFAICPATGAPILMRFEEVGPHE